MYSVGLKLRPHSVRISLQCYSPCSVTIVQSYRLCDCAIGAGRKASSASGLGNCRPLLWLRRNQAFDYWLGYKCR